MSAGGKTRLLAAWLSVLLWAGTAGALDLAGPTVGADVLHGRGYDGGGVEVGVVDLFQADGTHPALSGNYLGGLKFAVGGEWLDSHATEVAGCVASTDSTYPGIAPAAGFWTAQTTKRSVQTTVRNQTRAAETLAQGLDILNGNPAEVITLSIGLAGDTTAADQWSLALDHVVHTNGLTVTIAAGNSGPASNTIDGRPAGAYNAIVVGATGGTGGSASEDYSNIVYFSSRGPSDDGRAKPDIVAPGSIIHMPTLGGAWTDANGTSFATPIVAGGAALLIDMGRSLGHSTDPKVIKSVLLNSADKLAGWSNTPTRPLDHAQGAGQMDLAEAWRQYAFEEKTPGTTTGIGWDLGDVGYGQVRAYPLDLNLPAGAVLAATLAWDRVVTTDTEDIDDVVYALDHLDNLDLRLVRDDQPGVPAAESISAIDNVEHVYYAIQAAGKYSLHVVFNGGAPGDGETYGLSWRALPAAGLDFAGDANLDGTVDLADLSLLAFGFEQTDKTWFEGDFSGDGAVDLADLSMLAYHWGQNRPAAPVPAPSALAVLAGGGLAILRRRHA